jgi:hypothetical protein
MLNRPLLFLRLRFLHFHCISVPVAHNFTSTNMSAIPNLPNDIVRIDPAQPESKLRHALAEKGASQHVGHADVQSTTSNGVHSNDLKTEAAQWQLHDVPVDHQRPIKVIVIGAGYSGVYLGIRIPEKLRNCELVIYEKNAGVGGTW